MKYVGFLCTQIHQSFIADRIQIMQSPNGNVFASV